MKTQTKRVLAAIGAVIVVGAIAGGSYYYYQQNHKSEETTVLTPKEQAVQSYGDKQYDQAVQQIDNVISQSPDDADNYNFKANILRDKGDIAGAAENYNKAISLNPHVLAPYVNAANMYLNQGDKASAKAVVEKGLKEFPNQKALISLQSELK